MSVSQACSTTSEQVILDEPEPPERRTPLQYPFQSAFEGQIK